MTVDKTTRAVVFVEPTSLHGVPIKSGDVLLVPEEISQDVARELSRMRRPRVRPADKKETAERLKMYEKVQAQVAEKAKAQRDAEQAAAKLETDEAAQVLAEATATAKAIIAEAEARAADIIRAAEGGAGQSEDRRPPHGQ